MKFRRPGLFANAERYRKPSCTPGSSTCNTGTNAHLIDASKKVEFIDRRHMRAELFDKAQEEIRQVYGIIGRSGLFVGYHQNMPRRARRLVARRISKRWYKELRRANNMAPIERFMLNAHKRHSSLGVAASK